MKTRCAMLTILFLANIMFAGTWETVNVPIDTSWAIFSINGIDGHNIVGSYDPYNKHGFIYNHETKAVTALDVQNAKHTVPLDIEGTNVVGCYYDQSNNVHPFSYNGSDWTTLDTPWANKTIARSISGSNIVGSYKDNLNRTHGFLFDGITWTTIDQPHSYGTHILGVDGGVMVGFFEDAERSGDYETYYVSGFIYDGTTWTTLDAPGSNLTKALGIDGANVVGYYRKSPNEFHGFLYDGAIWTILDMPGAKRTFPTGIDGDKVIGYYMSNAGDHYPFIYTIPKPASMAVSIDIKPQSCPNPLNVASNGVLLVAILGSEEFDVNDIDPNSLQILGGSPLRSNFEDVAAPVAEEALPEDCLCSTEGPDGFMDLTLKFDTQAIIEAIGPVEDGEMIILTLTGSLQDETPIEGTDCVLILKKGKQ